MIKSLLWISGFLLCGGLAVAILGADSKYYAVLGLIGIIDMFLGIFLFCLSMSYSLNDEKHVGVV